jgi:hypothetical protein
MWDDWKTLSLTATAIVATAILAQSFSKTLKDEQQHYVMVCEHAGGEAVFGRYRHFCVKHDALIDFPS